MDPDQSKGPPFTHFCGSSLRLSEPPWVGSDGFTLKARFYITRVKEKVAAFVRQCLLCKHLKGPREIPRPYGLLTPTQRNEVVHWDFLILGDGFGDSAYLLVIKDGLSPFL
ncbi:hypothetical protein PC129_g15913 [Phytophthora cactorum]|uniref:Integrase zinc-binding domain-containing protein n=1 Tax=Phytophthora cactorum TaxID=29920 RepID=A0A8T0YPS7_9STRA|nr:hypothetical protein Pcac1_g4862 [Phytophthora cactorum]KAG2848988.1 hypothetical protein PC113_g17474 [Phytophthora cactorum]KAG2886971.1 hypothetical protein PC114_g19011 [Phytophthora cactorum]KAG2898501.1 hypothetical protein PC115_g16844 [Phytophthora cactorum]KAG2913804.1 hypothetical protein PC117_g18496 [Phytophthora cactorum]